MIPAINLGPFVLPTAALTYIIGGWLSLSLSERVARPLHLNAERLYNLTSTGVLVGLAGARLAFVALYWSAYRDNLLGIIWPINSGFNVWGGLFFGGAALFFYGRYKQHPFAITLDALAPIMVAGLITFSLADFLGGPGFGTYSTLPWSIEQFEISRHPVQIYEIIVGGVALLTWWQMQPRKTFDGQLFLIILAVYSFGRLFVDAFRANTWISSGGWHVVQIICLLMTVVALGLLAGGYSRFEKETGAG